MRVPPSFLAVTCALLPLAGLAAGETVPCAAHQAGAWFRYAKTDVYGNRTEHLAKIERIEGDRFLGTNEEGLPVTTDLSWNPYNVGERKASPKYYRIPECPFSLGETRVYKDVDYDGFAPGARERGTFTVTVDPEFTSLTLKAGSFKVVRVVAELAYVTRWNHEGKARTESYYAPDIGAVVKKEFHEAFPTREIRNRYELLEYSAAR